MQREKKQARKDEDGCYEEFSITYHPIKQGVYNIYLFGVIVSAQQFIGAIEVLAAAGPEDTVVIHLSTDGGDLDTTDTFIQAIYESEAHVVAKCSGGVHSAGTLIALAADEFQLSENANFLIHNGGVFNGGKYSDFVLQTEHTKRYFERVMRTSYAGFLSTSELDDLLKGVDIWLNSEEFVKRHEQRNAYFKLQHEVEEVAANAPPAKKAVKPKK